MRRGAFAMMLPEGSRMIIYTPDLTVSYDSPYVAQESTVVAAGSYVLFTGNGRDLFEYDDTV